MSSSSLDQAVLQLSSPPTLFLFPNVGSNPDFLDDVDGSTHHSVFYHSPNSLTFEAILFNSLPEIEIKSKKEVKLEEKGG